MTREFVVDGSSEMDKLGRYGVVHVNGDHRVVVLRRWLPSLPSRWDQWLDSRWRRLPPDSVRLYFNQPRPAPGFLVLAYAQAGPKTRPATLRRGLAVLERIAQLKRLHAIVCHATHPKLNERVMAYFGYQRHALSLGSHHYIRRLQSPTMTSNANNGILNLGNGVPSE